MRRKLIAMAAILPLLVLGFPSASSAYSLPVCTISGTERADRITGTAGDDVICAGSGNDIILAIGGNDTVYGGPGNDRIYGGSGSDELVGEAGTDFLDGGSQTDELSGGAGNDTISGGTGADTLEGGSGNDVLSGGKDADSVAGGTGKDKMTGDAGDDVLRGEAGNDNLSGGDGLDLIDGGKGTDTIRTGSGNDMCNADSADVRLDACTIDGEGPIFGPATTEVKQFAAGNMAVFAVNLSDAAGVQAVYGSIGGAPGWVTEWCGFLITADLALGTPRSGTYRLSCTIPQNAVNAGYTLELSAVDLMGNATRHSIAFEVTGGSADDQVPTLTRIGLPDSVAPGETFVISVDASDESRVAGIYIWFLLEGGGFSDENGLHAKGSEPRVISSNEVDSSFEQDYLFGDNAPEGTYKMWISVRDGVGNRDFFDTGRTIRLAK